MIKVKYETSDGTLFDEKGDAEKHEKSLNVKNEVAYENFLSRNKDLKTRLHEVGVWEVRGEDPNCDFGGHHHSPYLFTARGKLEDVIRKAVVTKGFWQWGAGGSITEKEIIEIVDV